MTSALRAMKESVFGIMAGFAVALILVKIAGESPVHILQILFRSAAQSPYDLGLTLFYSTPLIFSGLSVAIAFRAGLFNIGAEGQLTVACFVGAIVGNRCNGLSLSAQIFLMTVSGMLAGSVCSGIAGVLKAYRGSHEVISTMMLNFVVTGVTSWLTVDYFQNGETQNPETPNIAGLDRLMEVDPVRRLLPDSPASFAFVIAVFVAVTLWWVFTRTRFGFNLRAMGENGVAAKYAGLPTRKLQIMAMLFAGALSGMVVLSEVIGNSHRFKLGFSPGYGFTGIAVAFVARGNPLGVIPAALLFGALHKGTGDLDLETEKITRDFSQIIQSLIILAVGAQAFWRSKKNA